MIHTAKALGRPSLRSAKQLAQSYKRLPILSQIHKQPIRRLGICSVARKPLPTGEYIEPKSSSQIVRHCSYNRTMCRGKDDISGGGMDASKGREVLPTNVKPLHYDLILEPDFGKFTYEGKVVIEYVLWNMVKLHRLRRKPCSPALAQSRH